MLWIAMEASGLISRWIHEAHPALTCGHSAPSPSTISDLIRVER
jgi:hypothetical protein